MVGTQYFIGCDLGQAHDPSALGMIERNVSYGKKESEIISRYQVRHLERFPLETEYPVVVQRVSRIFKNPDIQTNGKLIVDETGVGRAVMDMMRAAKLHPIGITITSGNEVVQKPNGFNVPKKDLVTALLVLFQSGNFKISRKLPEAEIFIKELETFKVKISLRTGSESFEAWRERDHDDLVLSIAIAAWYATKNPLFAELSGKPWQADEKRAEEYDILGRD